MIEGLNEQESKFVEDKQKMFATEGWKTLVEDVTKRLEQIKFLVLNPKLSNEELRIAQGKADVMFEIIHLETLVEQIIANAQAEKETEGE